MRKTLFLTFILCNFLCLFAKAQQDSLFLINLPEDSQKVIEVVDSGKLQFYDINDSFVFIAYSKGNYRLQSLTNNNRTKGRIKLKKPFQPSPIVYSGFRGNTPHIGISQSNLFSEFHVDEDINYMGGGTVGDILKLRYIPKYNAVILHLLHDKAPPVYQLWLAPSFVVKNGKDIYRDVPTIVATPTVLYETKNISKISIHEESAKIAFLANDTVLMFYKLKDLTNSYGFYDLGTSFDFGFYNADSIFIIQPNCKASMLSLPKNYSRPLNIVANLNGMKDFKIVNQYLFCTKGNSLYINQITSNSVQPIREYSFNTKILSYKVSNDGKKILIRTGM